MGLIVGIDVGSSTTKIVGLRDDYSIISPQCVSASGPVTSLFGSFGKFLHENGISLNEIEHVMITGGGAQYIDGNLFDCPTSKIEEFYANGLGAKFGSNIEHLLVVSMGTGTSFVEVKGTEISHVGGMAIGGGTLAGLSELLLHTHDINDICEIAKTGDFSNVNLNIGDITNGSIGTLSEHVTASLFGKVRSNHINKQDIAAGLICTVLQTIGSGAVLAARNAGIKDFVLIGNLSRLPQCKTIYPMIENLYGVKFHIPTHSAYRTVIGAAIAYLENKKAK